MNCNCYIYRIDMKEKKTKKDTQKYLNRFLGGRALTSQIVLDEINPLCEPLGPHNKLILAPGLLGGTIAPCSGRLSVGAKSPLTGGIKESNAGGTFATSIAKLGVQALIIENQPCEDQWTSLFINKEGIKFLDAEEIAGAEIYQTARYYQDQFGKKITILCIGPAGEHTYRSASISVTDLEGLPTRHCGRGGLGAVMGSKKIKAIIVDNQGAPNLSFHNKAKFKEISKDWIKSLVEQKKPMTDYGTSGLVQAMNDLGCLPTHNFRYGQFKQANLINAEQLQKTIKDRGGKQGIPCHAGCVIRCGKRYHDKQGRYLTSGMEYETLALMGANCGISDLDTIAQMNRFCDDYGLDTMEMGVALGVVMESGLIPFGDGKKVLELLEEIREESLLGKLIAQGSALVGKVLGVYRVPVVKNQGIPGYDPRGLKGTGVTYITSSQGADHTAGNVLPGRTGYRSHTREVSDVQKAQNQAALSHDLQIMTGVCDLAGLCFFVGPTKENMAIIADLINARYGTSFNDQDMIQMGTELLKVEKEFNRQAGFNQANDRLPEFLYEEALPPKQLKFDVKQKEIEKEFIDI